MGEHTDYNASLCPPMALPHRMDAAVRERAGRRLKLASLQSALPCQLELDDARAGYPSGWGGYAAGVLWVPRGMPATRSKALTSWWTGGCHRAPGSPAL